MKKLLVCWLGVVTLSFGVMTTAAAQALFQEGVHYQRLNQAIPAGGGERPEVVEMFSYRCIHCFNFKPVADEWLQNKPDEVEFILVPVSFGRADWELMARAHYTAEELGVVDQLEPALYDAIHVEGKRLATPDEVAEVFVAEGVERSAFDEAFNSFAVETKLRRAEELTRRYRISGTPTLVINGQYVTSGSMAGSNARMFDVVEFLLRRDGATAG